MELKMTEKQFRRLLDLVYIGNWELHSPRGDARIKENEKGESLGSATVFEILAQERALRDMDDPPITPENYDEIMARMDAYLGEFEQHGTDNITVDMDE